VTKRCLPLAKFLDLTSEFVEPPAVHDIAGNIISPGKRQAIWGDTEDSTSSAHGAGIEPQPGAIVALSCVTGRTDRRHALKGLRCGLA
jgi:hypothetical protein